MLFASVAIWLLSPDTIIEYRELIIPDEVDVPINESNESDILLTPIPKNSRPKAG